MTSAAFNPDGRVDRANAAIDQLTAGEFIRLVTRRLSGIAPEDCALCAPLIELGCHLTREGARLAVIQETHNDR